MHSHFQANTLSWFDLSQFFPGLFSIQNLCAPKLEYTPPTPFAFGSCHLCCFFFQGKDGPRAFAQFSISHDFKAFPLLLVMS